MAAIIEPHRIPVAPQRPTLRLVPAVGGRPVDVPVDLGLGVAHLVAVVVALVVVMIGELAIGNGSLAGLAPGPAATGSAEAAAQAGQAPAGTQLVEVEVGDTLWSIARRIQPTGDVRPLVDELVALNGSAALLPGDQVVVPAG